MHRGTHPMHCPRRPQQWKRPLLGVPPAGSFRQCKKVLGVHKKAVNQYLLCCKTGTHLSLGRRGPALHPKRCRGLVDVSASLIREAAAHYSPVGVRTGNSKCASQVVSVLYRSSVNRVCGEGWALLRDRGIEPPTHEIAYKALSQMFDNLHQDFQGQTVLAKLQDILTQDEEFDLTCNERVSQVYRLMKRLNNLRTMCAICESEHIGTNPLDVAKKTKGFWSTVMVQGTSTVSEITLYLKSLPKFPRRALQSGLLLRPYDYPLTVTALHILKIGLSPGEDGICAHFYQTLGEAFLPQMHSDVQRIFDTGVIPPNLVAGLINSVPKVTGVPQVEQLRPFALQNVILKWFSNIPFIMLEPCIDYRVPLSQKGSIRGRKIFEHLWDTVGGWFHIEHSAFVSVDFFKAYDTILFNFCIAVFQVMGIPQLLIQVILALLRAPRKCIVNGLIVHQIMHVPQSGIGQADLLSPYLFVLMVSRYCMIYSSTTSVQYHECMWRT